MRQAIIENGIVVNVVKGEVENGVEILEGETPHIGLSFDLETRFEQPQPKVEDTELVIRGQRDSALNGLEYDFGDGRVIQTRPQDKDNFDESIAEMELNGSTERYWLMKDNLKYLVTLDELKLARAAGRAQATGVWDVMLSYVPTGTPTI